MKKLFDAISVTAELMGQAISPTASAVMGGDLEKYPREIVFEALARIRRESKGRFSLAAVVEQIERLQPDGRPSADEAWAMIPRDEYVSAVWTTEMQEAWGIAKQLLDEGDQVAARMTFKEVYARLVDTAKRDGKPVKWEPSLGLDKEMREPVLREAIRLGRLTVNHVCTAGLLAPESEIALLQEFGTKLAIEDKSTVSPEQARANIQRIKQMLSVSRIGKAA